MGEDSFSINGTGTIIYAHAKQLSYSLTQHYIQLLTQGPACKFVIEYSPCILMAMNWNAGTELKQNDLSRLKIPKLENNKLNTNSKFSNTQEYGLNFYHFIRE